VGAERFHHKESDERKMEPLRPIKENNIIYFLLRRTFIFYQQRQEKEIENDRK